MFVCPETGCRLLRMKQKGGMYWYSPESSGRLLTISMFRHFLGEHEAQEIWLRSESGSIGKYKCPGCQRMMVEVQEPQWIGPHIVDVCRSCHVVWLNKDEHPEIPHHTDIDANVEAARQRISHDEARLAGTEADSKRSAQPDSLLHSLPAFFMLPVKTDTGSFPALTLILIFIALVAARLFHLSGAGAAVYFGLNLYFFYLFSGDIEMELSRSEFLLFAAVSFLLPPVVLRVTGVAASTFAMAPVVVGMASLSYFLPVNARYSFLVPFIHYFHPHNTSDIWARIRGWRWWSIPQWSVMLIFVSLSAPRAAANWHSDHSLAWKVIILLEIVWGVVFRALV